nr:hypothetical protein Itr_chr12CG17140 [Ipomoea trifida]
MKFSQLGLKERVDLACIKMDLINENMAISGTNVLENQWSVKELQLLINHLSDQLNEALKDDATKGKKRLCKTQGQGRTDRGNKDDNDGRGGNGNES